MTFHATDRMGASANDLPLSQLPLLLDELDEDPSDLDHGCVSVTHETEWCLTVSRGGVVTWENLEAGEPRHMKGVARDRILSLWSSLARGDLDAIEREPWLPGYD